MKLAVIGFGQCGGRIADEFARLNKTARRQRSMDILIDAFAVNTDSADLAGLTTIKADFKHRILIGAGITQGHGVAKISELGAKIAKADADKIVDAFRETPDFFEADAILVIGAAAGGTGRAGRAGEPCRSPYCDCRAPQTQRCVNLTARRNVSARRTDLLSGRPIPK